MPKDGVPGRKKREKDDGLIGLKHHLRTLINLVAETARWVDPKTYRALPVWYPETARGLPVFDNGWIEHRVSARRSTPEQKVHIHEPNNRAGAAIRHGLGMTGWVNWTCCHIWSVDDPTFQTTNAIVKDPRHYSCVANLVLLPTPLKGLTDAIPEVKVALRTCAFHLYGWTPQDRVLTPDQIEQKRQIQAGVIPDYYPDDWPQSRDDRPPPGMVPINDFIRKKIDLRIRALREKLESEKELFPKYPREEVRAILAEGGLHL